MRRNGRDVIEKGEGMKEAIKQIAEHYGYEPQSRQLIEEMAELTQAINKFWRKDLDCGLYPFEKVELTSKKRLNIIEEIADVEIMIEQIKHLLRCEIDVVEVKQCKVNRQLHRIEKVKGQHD